MKLALLLISGLLLSGCTTMPNGPSRMALPGTGKSFDQFRYDESACSQFGLEQSGISTQQASNDSIARSAAATSRLQRSAAGADGTPARLPTLT